MTNEELLAEAKRRYPVGTIVISCMEEYQKYPMKIKHFSHSAQNVNEIFFKGDKTDNPYSNCNPCVYYKGKWAEIIQPSVLKEVNFDVFN